MICKGDVHVQENIGIEAQLFSFTISTNISLPNDSASPQQILNCSIGLAQNGTVLTTALQFQVLGSMTPLGPITEEGTVFVNVKPGTYQWQLWYSAITACTFSYSQISAQSYGAGSTMQSSGTF
jgi:hypothetical protein